MNLEGMKRLRLHGVVVAVDDARGVGPEARDRTLVVDPFQDIGREIWLIGVQLSGRAARNQKSVLNAAGIIIPAYNLVFVVDAAGGIAGVPDTGKLDPLLVRAALAQIADSLKRRVDVASGKFIVLVVDALDQVVQQRSPFCDLRDVSRRIALERYV